MRGALTFSNVMSVLAVFIALGGTAAAFQLGRNSVGTRNLKTGAVRSVDIANRQVKPIDTARALGFDCPLGTRYDGGSCIELATRPPATQVGAERRCLQEGRRLPTSAELQLLRFAPDTNLDEIGEWSDAFITYGDPTALWGVLYSTADPTAFIAPRSSARVRFRCVAPARR